MKTKSQLKTRHIAGIFTVSLVIFASTAWFLLNPQPSQQYMSIATLGSNMQANSYYANNDANLFTGNVTNWYIQVYNHMGTPEWVSVVFRITNSSYGPPNDTSDAPSPAPMITGYQQLIDTNQTWVMPFTWSISTLSTNGDLSAVNTIVVDNVTYSGLNIESPHGFNFGIIFELWAYNDSASAFNFGWNSGGRTNVAWNELSFNVSSS